MINLNYFFQFFCELKEDMKLRKEKTKLKDTLAIVDLIMKQDFNGALEKINQSNLSVLNEDFAHLYLYERRFHTVLGCAIRYAPFHLIQVLIDKKVNINSSDFPFSHVIESYNPDSVKIAKLLLDSGLDIKKCPQCRQPRMKDNYLNHSIYRYQPIFNLEQSLDEIDAKNKLEILELLIAHPDIKIEDNEGEVMSIFIEFCCRKEVIEVLKKLDGFDYEYMKKGYQKAFINFQQQYDFCQSLMIEEEKNFLLNHTFDIQKHSKKIHKI